MPGLALSGWSLYMKYEAAPAVIADALESLPDGDRSERSVRTRATGWSLSSSVRSNSSSWWTLVEGELAS